MALTIREGDVFTIPLTGEKVAIGQIASRLQRGKTAYFMIVYEGAHSEATVDVDSAVGAPIALQAITFDPLIRNGRWQRIANRPVPEDRIRWPIFRSMTAAPDKYAVIDHRLREVRSATRHEVKDLPHWTSVGPIELELATQALAGLRPWEPDFDHLLVSEGARQSGGGLAGKFLGRLRRDRRSTSRPS